MYPSRNRLNGFTLVEMMVVVLIISLLALIAIPALQHTKRRATSAALMNDFKTFTAAFEAYAAEKGTWPPSAAAGVIPSGMAGTLTQSGWTRVTPLGGHYVWQYKRASLFSRPTAAITIQSTSSSPVRVDLAQVLDLDQRYDDGSISTGNIQLSRFMTPLFIIEK